MRPFLIGANPSHDQLRPFETSCLLSPDIFAALRGLFALYIFTTIFFIYGWEGTHDDSDAIGTSFSYFTWLNFWGMGFYFLVASIHTLCYARTGRSVIFDRLPRFFRALHSLYYACVTTYPFLVLIVYWSILYSPPWFPVVFDAWQNLSQHGLIGLFSLLEILLPTTQPHPFLHLAFLILILLLYLCLAYIVHRTQGYYTYNFLDPGAHGEHGGRVAAYSIGILVGITIIFAVSWGLIWVRQRQVAGKIKRSARDRDYSYGAFQAGLEADRVNDGGAWREK
jgi:hypothetical protein